ncbi:unnamed protein product [Closterium sp. NIES-54]
MSAVDLDHALRSASVMYADDSSVEHSGYYSCLSSLGAVEVASAFLASIACTGSTTGVASLSFTLNSGASSCFFCDCTDLTPLRTPVSVALADSTAGPVVARSSTTLPCPAAPSRFLTGYYNPSFSRNLVGGSHLHDLGVVTTFPLVEPIAYCTIGVTGAPLATFHREPGSGLYSLHTRSHHSGQVRSGLPESLAPLPRSPVPLCTPCVEGRQRAAPHSSSFPPTTAPLQTLHLDIWGPSPGQCGLRLHSDRSGEFSSTRLEKFCQGRGIIQSYMLPDSPQQNGVAERRIGLVMEVARTFMCHAGAPKFLWPQAVRYATHQLNLWPSDARPRVTPVSLWTGSLGVAADFRFFASQDVTFDESVCYYRSCPHRGTEVFPPPLFLILEPPLVASCPVRCDACHSAVAVMSGGAGGAVAENEGTGAAGAGGVGSEGAGGVGMEFPPRSSLRPVAADPGGVPAGGTGGPGGVDGRGAGYGGVGAGGTGTVAPTPCTVRFRTHEQRLLQLEREERERFERAQHQQQSEQSHLQQQERVEEESHQQQERAEEGSRLQQQVQLQSQQERVEEDSRVQQQVQVQSQQESVEEESRPQQERVAQESRSPPELSLIVLHDPLSDYLRASRPVVSRVLSVLVTHPTAPLSSVSALVTTIAGFASSHRLDYAAHLVSVPSRSPSSGGALAFPLEVLEDRQFELGFLAVTVPHLCAMLLALEGDPDALDIPIPRTHAEALSATTSYNFSIAFLQGSLHEQIWRRCPPGFTGSFPAGTQWQLRRPVYGLRQAPCEWHNTLRTTLATLDFFPSSADPSFFICCGLTPFFVQVYVDDLVFATPDRHALASVKEELQRRHTCTDLGELQRYLGLQITRYRAAHTITLTQSHMVEQILTQFCFPFYKVQLIPLAVDHGLTAPPSDEPFESRGPYPELVGCLIYLMTCTRPDLAYPLSIPARFVAPGRHGPSHWYAAKRVAKYVASTSGMELVLEGSRQGYCFSLGTGAVLWRSTRASSVSSSSNEAEVYAAAMAAQKLCWLTFLLTDLGERPRSPPVLFADNRSAVLLCEEPRLVGKAKDI